MGKVFDSLIKMNVAEVITISSFLAIGEGQFSEEGEVIQRCSYL